MHDTYQLVLCMGVSYGNRQNKISGLSGADESAGLLNLWNLPYVRDDLVEV